MKVLWLSPTLNHYKARFLSKLQQDHNIKITVMAGTGRDGMGDVEVDHGVGFDLHRVNVSKKDFGFSSIVRTQLAKSFQEFDWVMIPKEDKNLLLFIYALRLRQKSIAAGNPTKLFSYNHPMVLTGPQEAGFLKKLVTKFYYRNYDRIIFYTRKGCERMINEKLIDKTKAFWANNTIDTSEVKANYGFCYPDKNEPTILFIGRLTQRKRLDICLNYYRKLKSVEGLGEDLRLVIIGDGPESDRVKLAADNDTTITWTGALVNEAEIAPFMSKASLVFIPGHSGLSVNHAFSYGRPMVTFGNIHQPPEIDYLEDGINGLVLSTNEAENLERIASIMLTFEPALYDQAYATGETLSVTDWCKQINEALNA